MKTEPFYMYAMRMCIRDNIVIYPISINNATYTLGINYKGWTHEFNTEYKKTPRFAKDKKWSNEIHKIYTILYLIKNNEKMKNILEEAIDIVYTRSSQKEKDYGPFENSMKEAAKIMTVITGKQITTRDFYAAMVSLKLARLRYSDKHDTYLDAIAYIASMSELKTVKPLIEKDFD